jgi:cell wall-associated NlpC family hydrolase
VTEPQPGDFGLVSIAGDVGRLIRLGQWLNGSGFSTMEHAFVFVGGGQLIEAMPGGARLAPVSEYDGRPIVWSSGKVELTDGQRAEVVAAARAMIGTPYSAADYFAIAAHRFHLPGGRWLRNYVASTKHEICSQLVDRAYAEGGVHLFQDGRWDGFCTPGDLFNLIS